jgi:hypothetical protein
MKITGQEYQFKLFLQASNATKMTFENNNATEQFLKTVIVMYSSKKPINSAPVMASYPSNLKEF